MWFFDKQLKIIELTSINAIMKAHLIPMNWCDTAYNRQRVKAYHLCK